MPNVIIAGSRSFNDYELAKKSLDYFLGQLSGITIFSGGAKGADAIGKRYAREHGIKNLEYPDISEVAHACDFCIMFWNGVSRGTGRMLEMCKKYNIEYRIRFFQETTQWPLVEKNKF